MNKKHRTNWHEAASCAMQIELRDYAHLLEFQSEYLLGKNNYRIDLLIIKKLTDSLIPKNIAKIFRTFNLLEIKGIGSSLTTDAYYKTIGYAGLLIDQTGTRNQYTRQNISLTFLTCHYPKKLMYHLKIDCKLTVEKYCPGVYYIDNETFYTQIIVTSELSKENNPYLKCLTNNLTDSGLITQLTNDY